MTAPLADPSALRRYAGAIVFDCLGLEAGETLAIDCEPVARELVVALADVCFAAGIDVDLDYREPLVGRSRLVHAPEALLGEVKEWRIRRISAQGRPGTAGLWIPAEEFPGLLADVDPARTALDQTLRNRRFDTFRRAMREGRVRWSIANWPTPAWAREVYPELDPLGAQRRLLADILSFCRLGPGDADGAWSDHVARLDSRAAALSALDLRELQLRAPGTELDVRLPPAAAWGSGRQATACGKTICVNFPTEEVFTSPVASATEGTFRCTRPLSAGGRMIDGIAGEFRGGRLVRLEASREADRDLLAGLLAADRGARRLGEVALVDAGSRIAAASRTYFNTGLDENVASHIAFGDAFPELAGDTPGTLEQLNRSRVHIDVMIGSPEMDVTGIDAGGVRIPIIRDGVFQLT